MGEAERLVRRRSHDPSMVATVKQLHGITSYRTGSAAMMCAPRRWTSLLSEQGESPGQEKWRTTNVDYSVVINPHEPETGSYSTVYQCSLSLRLVGCCVQY